MNHDCKHGNNSPQRQTPRIPHKHLSRERVIPQEPDRRPDKRSNKHHQLTRMWNIHDIRAIRIHHITRHVRQNTQCRSHDSRSPRCQTVQPIRQIRPVRHRCNNHDRDNNKHDPTDLLGIVPKKRPEPSVIKLVILEKRNRRLGRFNIFRQNRLAILGHKPLIYSAGYHPDFRNGNLLPDQHVIAHVKSYPHNQPQTHLSDHLETSLQPLLVLPEHLDIIIQKTDQPQPDRRNNHQLDIHVIQPGKQDHWHQNRQQDNHPAHRRCSLLLHLTFQSQVPDFLPNLLFL